MFHSGSGGLSLQPSARIRSFLELREEANPIHITRIHKNFTHTMVLNQLLFSIYCSSRLREDFAFLSVKIQHRHTAATPKNVRSRRQDVSHTIPHSHTHTISLPITSIWSVHSLRVRSEIRD